MTREELTACTRRDLAARARKHRVSGWHGMRKCELVEALFPLLRSGRRQNGRHAAVAKQTSGESNRLATGRSSRAVLKLVPADADAKPARQSRLVADVIDSNWIHACWTLTHRSLARARSALGSRWHQAMPVLRLFDVTVGDHAPAVDTWIRDIEIVSDSDNWYVPVSGAPRTFRLDLGYRTLSGDFLAIVRSQRLTTPSSESAISDHGTNNGHHSRTGRRRHVGTASLQSPSGRHDGVSSYRTAPLSDSSRRSDGTAATQEFLFDVQTELLVHGITHPRAKLSLMDETVSVEADGTFSVRYRLPNGRQVIPVVAVTPDGSEQHTILLAVERNTKVLEPRRLDELPL